MPALIERLTDQPVILITVTEPFNAYQELPQIEPRFRELSATIEGPVYRIIDVSRWNAKFTDLVNGLAFDTRANGGVSKDSRIHTVMIGSDAMAKMSTEAIKQQQYGGVQQPLFSSLDEALAYIRADLRKAQE